jgi:ABC-2 type transport system ATP-binding protein
MLETYELTKRYGAFTALDHCSLNVPGHEIFGLLGPNGAGKSTLIRTSMGFLHPTSGRATLAGFDCERQSLEVRQRVAYLPGDVRLFRWMRGTAVLDFLCRLHPAGEVRRARDIAERLQVDTSRRVAMCSSGMRQKLALAATFALNTPVLILDEPTTHLDPTARSMVLTLVREAHAAGRTVIFSSHVISEVEAVCHRVAIMQGGRIVHAETLSRLPRRHRIEARAREESIVVPHELRDRVTRIATADGHPRWDVDGELSSVLPWLAGLELRELRIEPLGLQTVYDEMTPADAT